MSRDLEIEVYRTLRTSQDKYSYFLLAAAGAAIAFSVTQTQDDVLGWSQSPLAVAVALWGVSFYLGCQSIRYVNSTLYANGDLLKVEAGRHPSVGDHPQMMMAASEGIRSAIESNSQKTQSLGEWQFRTLIAGAAFFVLWHVIEMYLRMPEAGPLPS